MQVRGQYNQRCHEVPGGGVVPVRAGHHRLLRRGDPLLLHQPRHHQPPGHPGPGGPVTPTLGPHPLRGGGGEGHGGIHRSSHLQDLECKCLKQLVIQH